MLEVLLFELCQDACMHCTMFFELLHGLINIIRRYQVSKDSSHTTNDTTTLTYAVSHSRTQRTKGNTHHTVELKDGFDATVSPSFVAEPSLVHSSRAVCPFIGVPSISGGVASPPSASGVTGGTDLHSPSPSVPSLLQCLGGVVLLFVPLSILTPRHLPSSTL